MKKILVVVDMQNDFIDGALGTPEAVAIVDNVVEKIRGEEWDSIYGTLDTHFDDEYLSTQEGRKLPVKHCICQTLGHRTHKKISAAIDESNCNNTEPLLKTTFACLELVDWISRNYAYRTDMTDADLEITLVGVCTDICVIANALLLKTHFPEARIVVDASCCAGSTPEKHEAALNVMESCQIDILNEVSGDHKGILLVDYTRCDICPDVTRCVDEEWDVCKKED